MVFFSGLSGLLAGLLLGLCLRTLSVRAEPVCKSYFGRQPPSIIISEARVHKFRGNAKETILSVVGRPKAALPSYLFIGLV